MIIGKSLSKNISKDAAFYLAALFLSALIFFLAGVYINSFIHIEIPERIFLMFHVFAELISIVIAISIFVVLYFTFDLFKRKHYLILANTFLTVGIIDVFHTLTRDASAPRPKRAVTRRAAPSWQASTARRAR